MKIQTATIVFCFFLFNSYAGGPWSEAKKKGFVEASSLFNVGLDITDQIYQVYAEVGITDMVTLKTILPFKYISTPDIDGAPVEGGALFGISNLLLGAKYQFLNKKAVMAAGVDVSFKTLSRNDEKGLRTGFEKYTIMPIYSIGFGIKRLYSYGEIKPGFSTNGFGHELGLIYEFGGEVDEQIWLALYSELKLVFGNGSFNEMDLSSYEATGFFRDDKDFFTIGVKFLAALFGGFGISIGGFYGTSVSNEAGSAFSVKAGLFYDW